MEACVVNLNFRSTFTEHQFKIVWSSSNRSVPNRMMISTFVVDQNCNDAVTPINIACLQRLACFIFSFSFILQV